MAESKERFVIATENADFDGYRYGIKFHQGRAVVHSKEVRDVLVIDHGYRDVTRDAKEE